jgi:aminoglycoside phosphotransferase (APT) family kinase protein
MRGAFRRFAQIENTGPCCLIHGDTRLGNLYRTADGEPGFLDAQVSRTHRSFEVAYHIVGACDLADRPRWERALLQAYRSAMIANGIAMLSFDETFDAYARAIGYGLFVFLINEIRFQTEAVNTAYAARFGAAALHNNTKEQLR